MGRMYLQCTQQPSPQERMKEISEENYQTYLKKNHDYGDSVHECYVELGMASILTFITIKYKRLMTLGKLPDSERQVKDDSIKDTLRDLSNYCNMAVLELEREEWAIKRAL